MATRTIGGVTANFFYDAENRLATVQTADGTVVAQYHYDPFGRRMWKNVGGVMTHFMYSDEGLIGEYDASGQEITSYGYKPGGAWMGDLLFMRQGGQFYFYQNDALGTPKMMTSATGAVVWSATYDAFGQAQVLVSSVINNIRLPGQYYDGETGLHYNFRRDYDPVAGRYVEADPLGFDGSDVNLFAYVSNNPENKIDPSGLFQTDGAWDGKRNTIVCDGNGGIAIRITTVNTPVLKDCSQEHEATHMAQALAQKPNICKGIKENTMLVYSNDTERNKSEIGAYNVELACLKSKLEQCVNTNDRLAIMGRIFQIEDEALVKYK